MRGGWWRRTSTEQADTGSGRLRTRENGKPRPRTEQQLMKVRACFTADAAASTERDSTSRYGRRLPRCGISIQPMSIMGQQRTNGDASVGPHHPNCGHWWARAVAGLCVPIANMSAAKNPHSIETLRPARQGPRKRESERFGSRQIDDEIRTWWCSTGRAPGIRAGDSVDIIGGAPQKGGGLVP